MTLRCKLFIFRKALLLEIEIQLITTHTLSEVRVLNDFTKIKAKPNFSGIKAFLDQKNDKTAIELTFYVPFRVNSKDIHRP